MIKISDNWGLNPILRSLFHKDHHAKYLENLCIHYPVLLCSGCSAPIKVSVIEKAKFIYESIKER